MRLGLLITNLCRGSVRPQSVMSCVEPWAVTDSILAVSSHFDCCLVVNDEHRPNDKEFNHLPPHMLYDSEDTFRLDHVENVLAKNVRSFQFLKKNTSDATVSDHNNLTIMSYCCDLICVAGFTASHDVFDTAQSLRSEGKDVLIIEECIGDLNIELKEAVLADMRELNIEVTTKQRFIDANKRQN